MKRREIPENVIEVLDKAAPTVARLGQARTMWEIARGRDDIEAEQLVRLMEALEDEVAVYADAICNDMLEVGG